MPNNYNFLDAAQSVLTARSSITSGSAQEPFVIISSMPTVTIIPSGNQSVSGTTGASIVGQLPGGTALVGSIVTLQGTSPWVINGSVSGTVNIGTIPGSVLSFQAGTQVTSVVGSIPSSLLTGNYGHRNDAVASYLGGNLSWTPIATDSAGRILTKAEAAEEARIEGYSSTVNTSQTTLVAAAGAGLRNYITDAWFFNTGAAATLITFKDGAGSILGYTGAPAGSGSNLPGLVTPIRTGANATFDFQASTGTSILYATVKGYKAP